MMARIAEFRDDISGALTTGGTSTAFTLTSNRVFGSLAVMDKAMICFIPHTTSGASPTLNVDGLGAKQIRAATGQNVDAGALVAGTPYQVIYLNSSTEFILINSSSHFGIPIGGSIDYWASVAPNSNFALMFGQAISRTTYATLFFLFSTAYGSGDGSTTFNIPDCRGRVIPGADNMGGSAANRLTTASGMNFGTLSGTGGVETVTVAQANLPNYTLPNTLGVSITDPTHFHGGGDLFDAVGTTSFSPGGATGVNAVNNTGPGNTASASTGISASITGSITSGGSGTALTNMPPAIVANKLLRIL